MHNRDSTSSTAGRRLVHVVFIILTFDHAVSNIPRFETLYKYPRRRCIVEINVMDASNYFKGLLLLIRKDRKVTDAEAAMISRIGKKLGFEKEFCETAIREIISNKYIEDTPPQFSSRELAMMFVKDSLAVALSDGMLDYKEEKWLRSVVDRNLLSRRWFVRELENATTLKRNVDHLEADGLTVTNMI